MPTQLIHPILPQSWTSRSDLDPTAARLVTEYNVVLVSAAYLEEALEHLLRRRLSANRSVLEVEDVEWLLTGSGGQSPFGTFHSRIVACSALGLITPSTRDVLLTLKETRNLYAHRDRKRRTPPKLTTELGSDLINKVSPLQKGVVKTSDIIDKVSESVRRKTATLVKHRALRMARHTKSNKAVEGFMDDEIDSELKELMPRMFFVIAVVLLLDTISSLP